MLIEGLYQVENKSGVGEQVNARIRFDPAHRVFAGHFPGQPVLPGVCMIQILKEILADSLGTPLALVDADNKFLSQLDPRVNPVAMVELNMEKLDGSLLRASGRLYYADMTFLKFKGTFSTDLHAFHTGS